MENNIKKIDISSLAVLRVIGIFAGLWFLYLIRDVLIILFISLAIVAAFSSVVSRWSQKMPRLVAVGIIYLVFLFALLAIGFLIIPPVVSETAQLADNVPSYISRAQPLYSAFRDSHGNLIVVLQKALVGISDQLANISSGLFYTTLGIFGGIITILTILVLTFYFMLEEQGVKKFLVSLMPVEQKDQVVKSIYKIGNKMGAWLRGQLILSLVIGIVSGASLSIVGVPYALTLGVWAGFWEVVPYIGPIIGAVPAILLALFVSPVKALIVLILFIVIQQLEANILVPKVMNKTVGLSPVIIILALLIGGKLMGVLGAILAIPVAAIISVLVEDWPELKKDIKAIRY